MIAFGQPHGATAMFMKQQAAVMDAVFTKLSTMEQRADQLLAKGNVLNMLNSKGNEIWKQNVR